jgi:hypothetical protein
MYSIGDLIDKLIIENIKIFSLRDKLKLVEEDDNEYLSIYQKMMTLVENRAIISDLLDEKISKVTSGEEKNTYLKKIRTYE